MSAQTETTQATESTASTETHGVELTAVAATKVNEIRDAEAIEGNMALRLRVYQAMIEDAAVIRAQEYPWSTSLLRECRKAGYPIGVATMSHRSHAVLVLDRLGLTDQVDVLVTREDVLRPKPDPEIYLLTATRLGAEPRDCFVLEDSLPGVVAAIAAGTCCVAITNDLTRDAIHAAHVLPPERVVDDPAQLGTVARAVLADLAPAM